MANFDAFSANSVTDSFLESRLHARERFAALEIVFLVNLSSIPFALTTPSGDPLWYNDWFTLYRGEPTAIYEPGGFPQLAGIPLHAPSTWRYSLVTFYHSDYPFTVSPFVKTYADLYNLFFDIPREFHWDVNGSVWDWGVFEIGPVWGGDASDGHGAIVAAFSALGSQMRSDAIPVFVFVDVQDWQSPDHQNGPYLEAPFPHSMNDSLPLMQQYGARIYCTLRRDRGPFGRVWGKSQPFLLGEQVGGKLTVTSESTTDTSPTGPLFYFPHISYDPRDWANYLLNVATDLLEIPPA